MGPGNRALPLNENIAGVQITVAKACFSQSAEESSRHLKSLQPLQGSSDSLPSGIEKGIHQIGGMGDVLRYQICPVEKGGVIDSGGHDPRGWDAPGPGALADPELVKWARRSQLEETVPQKGRQDSASPGKVSYRPPFSSARAPFPASLFRDGEDRLSPREIEDLPVTGCGFIQGFSTLHDVPDPGDGFQSGKNLCARVIHDFEPWEGRTLPQPGEPLLRAHQMKLRPRSTMGMLRI